MTESTGHERARLLDTEERDSETTESTAVSDKPTPLPWRSLLALFVLNAMQPLALEIIFPFVNQMIIEIGIVTDPKRVGFYSGLIESVFSCMSFIAVLPCSYLADVVGRKPVILCGMVGMGISVACFGMSRSLLAMMLSRCLAGTLGGTWATAKVMVGEMTDRSNQGTAFSGLIVAYRTGQIIGLPLGGLLAHPERNFPIFRSKFWYKYPFALPCFVASAAVFAAVTWGHFTVEETLASKKQKDLDKPSSTYGTMVIPPNTPSDLATSTPVSLVQYCPPENTEIVRPSFRSLLSPSIISLLCSNIAMCFASEMLFSLFPLFAFTPISSGGLGMNEGSIGIQMAIRSVLHIGTMGFFGPLQRRLGTVRVYQLVMWMWPSTVICFPILNYLARRDTESTWLFNLELIFVFFIWSCAGLAWTPISIMVNDAAPSAGALARLNGVSQMAIVFPQAIAPAFSTSLFAFSIRSGILGGNLVWIVLFAWTSAAAAHSLTLREASSDWRLEAKMSKNSRR